MKMLLQIAFLGLIAIAINADPSKQISLERILSDGRTDDISNGIVTSLIAKRYGKNL